MSNVQELINQIKAIDDERNTLNRLEYFRPEEANAASLFAQVHEDYIEDYASEWSCEATFVAVDTSFEERAESLVWQLADALAFSFEETCKYYAQQIGKGDTK